MKRFESPLRENINAELLFEESAVVVSITSIPAFKLVLFILAFACFSFCISCSSLERTEYSKAGKNASNGMFKVAASGSLIFMLRKWANPAPGPVFRLVAAIFHNSIQNAGLYYWVIRLFLHTSGNKEIPASPHRK